jgi:hypothetical protein
MMYYAFENITNPVQFMLYSNKVTGYNMGAAIVAAFFVIMFISMKRFETEKAFAASAFLTTLLCFLFFLIGLTSVNHLFLCSIAVLASIFLLNKSQGAV